jgi:hypothetical protein
MRCTPMTYTPHEVHAREMHAYEVYPHEMHVHEMHAYEIYDHKVHAHETPTHYCFSSSLAQTVVDLSRSESQNASFYVSCGVVPIARRNHTKIW